MYKLFYLAVLSILLISCSAVGPKFSPVELTNTNESLVYIYRDDSFCLAARSPDIHIDGGIVSALSSNGYIFANVKPGVHLLEAKGLFDLPSKSIEFEAIKGKSHYIKWSAECGFFTWKLSLVEIPEETALREISVTKLQR